MGLLWPPLGRKLITGHDLIFEIAALQPADFGKISWATQAVAGRTRRWMTAFKPIEIGRGYIQISHLGIVERVVEVPVMASPTRSSALEREWGWSVDATFCVVPLIESRREQDRKDNFYFGQPPLELGLAGLRPAVSSGDR